VSWVNNDDVHRGLKVVFGDKNIHSSSGVMKEKMGDLSRNLCFTFQNNNCDGISKCIVNYYTLTPTMALKQMGA